MTSASADPTYVLDPERRIPDDTLCRAWQRVLDSRAARDACPRVPLIEAEHIRAWGDWFALFVEAR